MVEKAKKVWHNKAIWKKCDDIIKTILSIRSYFERNVLDKRLYY